jgi:hypothetical protein
VPGRMLPSTGIRRVPKVNGSRFDHSFVRRFAVRPGGDLLCRPRPPWGCFEAFRYSPSTSQACRGLPRYLW